MGIDQEGVFLLGRITSCCTAGLEFVDGNNTLA